MNTTNNSGKLYSDVLASRSSNGNVMTQTLSSTSAQPRISLATNSISVVPNNTGILATSSTHAESSTGIILTTPSPAASPDLVAPPTTVHVCPKCPKTFTRKDALTRHMATHNKPVKRTQPRDQPSTSTPKRRRAEKVADVFATHTIYPSPSECEDMLKSLEEARLEIVNSLEEKLIFSGAVKWYAVVKARMYRDGVNGWAMSQPLPVGNFQWIDPEVTEQDILGWADDGADGFILEEMMDDVG
ncbi:hypothetical protein JTE90_022906 [Oedothorax gibbosus]|uniref:C2H2-type domain-containing protein n=1 Tax=Oedothorax gibbosus TaxID=931172 RepID=A0AAV6TMG3_9ARAC|nr:hypothetical protein JTE90_022906 [Oedothorax gibbosus]